MKISSVLICIFFQILLQNAVRAEVSEATDVSMKPDVSITRSIKMLINADDVVVDDVVNVDINSCLKSALKNNTSLIMKDYQPDLIVHILARQIQTESKDPVIMLSMIVNEPFDNVAVIKHWASGFRQAFPYGATIALNNSTRGLVRHKNHWVESAPRSSLSLLCKELIKHI